MSKRWRIKPGRNLRENARLVVPLMVDDFLSYRERVVTHPRLKQELHRMRLAGKTLRYAMEVFESGFNAEFSLALEEVKLLLETMGQIHDCDVNIPRLQEYLKEMRLYNRSRDDMQDRLTTSALTALLRTQSLRRKQLFSEMSTILERWERENFVAGLLDSMRSDNL